MAEIAIISARKSRLQQLIAKGNQNAKIALDLAQNPDKFFPAIQIGITLISILAGAIGEATLSKSFAKILIQIPVIGPYHNAVSFVLVVGGITYISLIIGELVPKQIAINHTENIAVSVAPFMQKLLKATLPLVRFLSFSSELVLKFLRINPSFIPNTSEDEIRLLMSEGTRAGIFTVIEKKLVDRVLHLDTLRVDSLMTPRGAIQWFDISKFSKGFDQYLANYEHSKIVLCDKTIDAVVGIIHVKDYLRHYIRDPKMDTKIYSQKPHFIPENTPAIKALELFRTSPVHIALVINEYGAVQGLITINDVLEAIVGDIQARNWGDKPKIIKRPDNSFLLDGALTLEELKDVLKLEALPKEAYKYVTLGGFIIARLNKIPAEGDRVVWSGYEFEVIDMDRNRVDKVLARAENKN